MMAVDMRRRKYLQLIGSGGIAPPFAGCAEEETDEAEGSVEAEDSGEDESESDSGSEEGDEGDSEGGLEIVEHQFYEEEFQAGVEGIVANNTGNTLDYVEVKAWFYDEDGTQIDDSLDNTENLEDGQQWAFDVILLQAEPEEVADYEIEVSDSPFWTSNQYSPGRILFLFDINE